MRSNDSSFAGKAEDGWLWRSAGLPGCITGRTGKRRSKNIKEAITAWLWAEDQKAGSAGSDSDARGGRSLTAADVKQIGSARQHFGKEQRTPRKAGWQVMGKWEVTCDDKSGVRTNLHPATQRAPRGATALIRAAGMTVDEFLTCLRRAARAKKNSHLCNQNRKSGRPRES